MSSNPVQVSFIICFCANLLISIAFQATDKVSVPLPLPDHTLWNMELHKYVTADGHVNFKAWAAHPELLHNYLDFITQSAPLPNWSRNVQLSYWLNVYNASVVRMIVDHYPIASMQDLHDGKPREWVGIKIGAQTYSLKQLEDEVIRKQFHEPEVVFALYRAAQSSPSLYYEAFDPAHLDAQLQSIVSHFVNDRRFNETTTHPMQVSSLFDWYKSDFKPDVHSFLRKYAVPPIDSTVVDIQYNSFDWRLDD
jgi:hypothetical protein